MENFKDVTIEGLEHYAVSNLGRVINNKYKNPRFLKPQTDAVGYQHVRLFPDDRRFGIYPEGRGKKPKLLKVHRLVAMHFVPYPEGDEKWEVNHKNADKTDNRAENLEWVTHEQNLQHSWDLGLRTNGVEKTAAKLRKPLKVHFEDGTVEYFESRTHAGLALNVSVPTIVTKAISWKKGSPTLGRAGFMVEPIDELPPGETFKSIVGLENKLLEYRKKYFDPVKMKKYRDNRKRKKLKK